MFHVARTRGGIRWISGFAARGSISFVAFLSYGHLVWFGLGSRRPRPNLRRISRDSLSKKARSKKFRCRVTPPSRRQRRRPRPRPPRRRRIRARVAFARHRSRADLSGTFAYSSTERRRGANDRAPEKFRAATRAFVNISPRVEGYGDSRTTPWSVWRCASPRRARALSTSARR